VIRIPPELDALVGKLVDHHLGAPKIPVRSVAGVVARARLEALTHYPISVRRSSLPAFLLRVGFADHSNLLVEGLRDPPHLALGRLQTSCCLSLLSTANCGFDLTVEASNFGTSDRVRILELAHLIQRTLYHLQLLRALLARHRLL